MGFAIKGWSISWLKLNLDTKSGSVHLKGGTVFLISRDEQNYTCTYFRTKSCNSRWQSEWNWESDGDRPCATGWQRRPWKCMLCKHIQLLI
jgi:hypothetical protein